MKDLTGAELEQLLESSDKPVLVEWWAEWCGPCKALSPQLTRAAEIVKADVTVVKVNVDYNPFISQKYGVASLPTLMLFRNGNVHAFATNIRTTRGILGFLADNLELGGLQWEQ